jgi:hypothetical protein
MKYMTFGFQVNASGDRSNPWLAGEYLWTPTESFGANGTETHMVWEYGAYSTTDENASDPSYNPPPR